jgi:peroxiredoxin
MSLINKKIILSVIVIVLIFSFIPIASQAICKKKGEVAPDFTLKDIYGKDVTLSDFRGEKNVLITFWATWCANCWEEIDFIQSSLKKNDDLVILLINMETRASSEAHLKKIVEAVEGLKLDFPVLLDLQLKAYKDYCIMSLPSTAIIDKEGVIQYSGRHFYKAAREKINEVINELTKEAGSTEETEAEPTKETEE